MKITKFKSSKDSFTEIDKWKHQNLELLLLKIPPTQSKPTSFVIIGRTDPEMDYEQNGSPNESYIQTKMKFNKLITQIKESFNV